MHPVAEMTQFEDMVSRRPEYIYKYRHAFGYHPFHGFSMIYAAGITLKHCSAIFVPGARHPGNARAMGTIPTHNFDEALKGTERYVGKNPNIMVLQDYLTQVPAHLFVK